MPGTPHPRSYTGWGATGFPWGIDVHYRLTSRYGLEVVGARTPLGTTFGLHRASYARLTLEYDVTDVGAMVTAQLAPGLRIGAGPSIHRTTFTEGQPAPIGHARTTRPGLLAAVNLAWPARSRIFVELSMQGRLVSSLDVGPYTAVDGDIAVTVPRTSVNVSHWFLGVGSGVRF
jgi:hypothetical protein